MNICGFVPQSTVDYPDHISAVVFTSPCNFNCGFCYNSQFIRHAPPVLSVPALLVELKKRKKFLDAVVITGGEPTLQKDLESVIRKIRALGLKVKLDTNGYRPKVLRRLLTKNLVDYVAMDVKAPLKKYAAVVGRNINLGHIRESITALCDWDGDYEFRTTVLPEFTQGDIRDIAWLLCYPALYIAGSKNTVAKRYVLQAFLPTHAKGLKYRRETATAKGTLQKWKIMLQSKYAATQFEVR